MDILLGVGGATDSKLALRETVARVAETDDRLTVAILADAGSPASVSELRTLVDEEARDAGVAVSVEVLEGDPGPALTTMAESNGFDCIVIGGGKRSPMGKISLGDVTEFLVLNADTTVTLVR